MLVAFVPISTDVNVLLLLYDDWKIVWSDDVLVVLSLYVNIVSVNTGAGISFC